MTQDSRSEFRRPWFPRLDPEDTAMECIGGILERGVRWLLVVRAKIRGSRLCAIEETRIQSRLSAPFPAEDSRSVCTKTDRETMGCWQRNQHRCHREGSVRSIGNRVQAKRAWPIVLQMLADCESGAVSRMERLFATEGLVAGSPSDGAGALRGGSGCPWKSHPGPFSTTTAPGGESLDRQFARGRVPRAGESEARLNGRRSCLLSTEK